MNINMHTHISKIEYGIQWKLEDREKEIEIERKRRTKKQRSHNHSHKQTLISSLKNHIQMSAIALKLRIISPCLCSFGG